MPTRKAYVGSLETATIKINDTISIGWMPLITLLVRSPCWRGLACSSSTPGKAERSVATSDDPDAAG